MSTQNKYDLKILGNIIVDDIYCIPGFNKEGTSNIFNSHKISVGGIGNIITALDNKDLKIIVECNIGNDPDGLLVKKFLQTKNVITKLHLSKKQTSRALILSNLKLKERTSFVDWGCGFDQIVSSEKVKWTHISYLDIISSLNMKNIKNNSEIISADLCLSNPSKKTIKSILNKLKYIDYLFVSESEIYSLIDDPKNLIKKYHLKCLIFHTRNETIIIKENYYNKIINTQKIIENTNVLGAGDVYCSGFILSKLNKKTDVKSIIYAHRQATKLVLSKI